MREGAHSVSASDAMMTTTLQPPQIRCSLQPLLPTLTLNGGVLYQTERKELFGQLNNASNDVVVFRVPGETILGSVNTHETDLMHRTMQPSSTSPDGNKNDG